MILANVHVELNPYQHPVWRLGFWKVISSGGWNPYEED